MQRRKNTSIIKGQRRAFQDEGLVYPKECGAKTGQGE
jgi:hypothetical protein